MRHNYDTRRHLWVGIEEEYQVVDAQSRSLVASSEAVIGHASVPESAGHLSLELFGCMLEAATPPMGPHASPTKAIRDLREFASRHARRAGVRLIAAGSHPVDDYQDQPITDRPRYRKMHEELRWIAEIQMCFGQHVHIGLSTPEVAVRVHNHLTRHVPHLTALSANSPYWRGRDCGFDTSRVHVLRALPRSGVPPLWYDYSHFEETIASYLTLGAIESYTQCWWDVRPHPDLGTVEIRVLDTQSCAEDAGAMAAFIACLAVEAAEGNDVSGPQGYEHIALEEHKWRASKSGLEARINEPRGEVSIRELIRDTVHRLQPIAGSRGYAAEMDRIDWILAHGGNGASRQRASTQDLGVAGLLQGLSID